MHRDSCLREGGGGGFGGDLPALRKLRESCRHVGGNPAIHCTSCRSACSPRFFGRPAAIVLAYTSTTRSEHQSIMSAGPPTGPGVLKQLWRRWKTLRLPWRRQFLAGADLAGNTFWEFKDAMNAQRFRRMVKYVNQGHYADVKISRKL